MPSPIQTRRIPARTVASISRNVTPAEIGGFMRGAIDTLRSLIDDGTLQATDSPFAVYHEKISADRPGRVELCWPVQRPAEPLQAAVLVDEPAMEVACSTILFGESDHVAQAFDALFAWIAGQGMAPAGPAREVYLTPRDGIGPGDPYIEIEVPVSRG